MRSVRRTTGGGAELSDPISYHHHDHYDPHHHYHHYHHHRHPQECLQSAVSISPDSSINFCSLSASNLSCHWKTKMKCHDGTANKSIHFLAFSYRLLYIFYDVRVVDPDNGSVEMNDKNETRDATISVMCEGSLRKLCCSFTSCRSIILLLLPCF